MAVLAEPIAKETMSDPKVLREKFDLIFSYTRPVKPPERKVIGREPLMASMLAAFNRPELSNVLLLAEAGSGKALANDTPIPVMDARGFVSMGELRVGDIVYGDDGYPCIVQGVFPQGMQRACRVTFDDGSSVLCSSEHLWLVKDVAAGPDAEWEVRLAGDFLDSISPTSLWAVPRTSAVERPWQPLPWEPAFVGAELAKPTTIFDPDVFGEYLFASAAQRRELLDSFVANFGQRALAGPRGPVTPAPSSGHLLLDLCGYPSGLSEAMATLATSLGMRASLSGGVLELGSSLGERDGEAVIVSVEDTGEDVPMTCIAVDSASSCFLATHRHIVTHNTALVQGLSDMDRSRTYLEVDLARMIAAMPDPSKLAAALKRLFDQVGEYNSLAGTKEVVLFMDEFHQIVSISPVAVEALKPLLADSGTRGIRVICATTYREFRDYISKNQPLVERLQRINVPEPDREATVAILKGMAERYDVANRVPSDKIYDLIYEYTERYVPANAQPRKSLLVLDAMIGWHKATGRPLNLDLLADVIYESEGVNVAFRVDASTIKAKLDAKVYAQDYATSAVAKRLQICVADLNDHTKPMSSLLFTGSTGTGKTELSKQLAKLLFDDSRALLRMDMTEFSTADSVERFRDELTTRVWERPFSIILLDEIEKACAEVTRMLLQVLDDGRLSDRNGRETSFLNSYVIMTTNVASEVYKTVAQYRSSDTGAASAMAGYDKVIRRSILSTAGDNRFPPELLGRIDVIVPFQPLSENTMKRIVRAKLDKLRAELLAKHEVMMEVTDDVIRYLVEDTMDTDSDAGGARAVVSKLEDEVTCAVATFVNEHPDARDIVVSIRGTLAADDKTTRVGTAEVFVEERIRMGFSA